MKRIGVALCLFIVMASCFTLGRGTAFPPQTPHAWKWYELEANLARLRGDPQMDEDVAIYVPSEGVWLKMYNLNRNPLVIVADFDTTP